MLGVINRFHLTIRQYLRRYMIKHNSKKWYKAIQGLVDGYNNSGCPSNSAEEPR
jgi:hypothetical protein